MQGKLIINKVAKGLRKKEKGSEAVGSQDGDSATIHAHGEGFFWGLDSEGESAQERKSNAVLCYK
jgi:hypothetical protein